MKHVAMGITVAMLCKLAAAELITWTDVKFLIEQSSTQLLSIHGNAWREHDGF